MVMVYSGPEAEEAYERLMNAELEEEVMAARKTSNTYHEKESQVKSIEDFTGPAVRYDNVANPDHYCEGREYEPRKVIEDWDLDFYLGNVVKYVSRAGRKGSALEDLRKAQQYLEWEIEKLEKREREGR